MTETGCVPRDAHCWHEVPIYYLGTDEPFEAICCHCGSHHSAREKPEIPLGHGQYFPKPIRDIFNPLADVADRSPCVPNLGGSYSGEPMSPEPP